MTDPFADDAELDELEAAQRAEYAKWEAAEVITTNGVLAYDVGHPVGLDVVARLGYAEQGKVRPQLSYVDDNPDDPDVKHFLAFAKKHPEHPAAVALARHQERTEAREAAEGPRLTFGGAGDKAADKPKAAAGPAEAKTTTTKG